MTGRSRYTGIIITVLILMLFSVAPSFATGGADGRVYNVTATSGANIRSCASTSCPVIATVKYGSDVQNDASAGSKKANGYTWIKVVYRYGSTNPCNTSQSKGWIASSLVSPGKPVVTVSAGANLRSTACNGGIVGTAPRGTTLGFYQNDNQWKNKWYEVVRPDGTRRSSWIDGWDLTDVR